VQGRSATLSHTFLTGSTATDPTPDTATVTVTRADGTTFVPTASVDNSATGVASITFTPAETALLDRWTLTWTATFGGQAQMYKDTVEVAGDVLFTIAQARAAGLSDPAVYTDDRIREARTYSETEIESALGFALVPRYSLDTLSGMGRPGLRVRYPYVRAIRSISISGVPLATADVAAITSNAGVLYGYTWPIGYANVLVGYEHGLPSPPPGATRAALDEAVAYLGGGTSVDPRTTRVVTADGTQEYQVGSGALLSAMADRWVSHNRIPVLA
jgi:hypothetical protein